MGRGCTTAIIDGKLLAEKARLEGKVLFNVFLDLSKAYDTVDRERLLILLEDYGVGPKCRAVLAATWEESLMVPKRGGQFGAAVPTTRGVRQGDIISPTLFNIIVDAVLRYVDRRALEYFGANLMPSTLFYADDGMISGRDSQAIQGSLDTVIAGFARVGVKVNRGKTKWMYTAGSTQVNRIQHGAYCNLVTGGSDSYVDRGWMIVKCPVCAMDIQRRCLQRHLHNLHPERIGQTRIDFFSPTPQRASGPRRYVVGPPPVGCPVPLCPYEASTATNLFRHFAARHTEDDLHIAGYPGYNKCPRCQQYVKGQEPSARHLNSALCQRGKKRWEAREAEEELARQLGNLPTFYIEGREIDRVDEFTYLGKQVSSEDDDLRACLRNLAKAKAKWAALSRVLKKDGASVAYKSRIYLIVVSTVLLYGAETWVITDRIRRILSSFHHSCARHILRCYICRVPADDNPDGDRWIYPSTEAVLHKAKLQPIMDYTKKRQEVFHSNYLVWSPLFAESKTWKSAGHVRNFTRYHQQFTSNLEVTREA